MRIYPSSSAAFDIFVRVSSGSFVSPLSTRDTVLTEKPHCSATSLSVMRPVLSAMVFTPYLSEMLITPQTLMQTASFCFASYRSVPAQQLRCRCFGGCRARTDEVRQLKRKCA